MKRALLAVFAAFILAVVTIPFGKTGSPSLTMVPLVEAAAPYQISSPCTPPTQQAATPEETAWQIFVAATCPVNSDKYPYVTWENWIEQSDLYSPTVQATATATKTHKLHGSPLANAIAAARKKKSGGLQAANENCNVSALTGRTICEEVRINPDAQHYITGTAGGLQKRANQAKLAASGGTIDFTPPSVEIKVDWIQLTTCSNPPEGVHVERIGTTCYALAGMHLISKLTPNWIWATFEPQNLTTNPQRCVAEGCNDPWGSSPAYSQGGTGGVTQLSTSLKQLMTAANLAPEWFNYRLNGVQMVFNNIGNNQLANATILGNSIIEGENAGVPMLQASCITCHSTSTVAANGADGISAFPTSFFNPVGSDVTTPPSYYGTCKWIQRDFVWSLLLAYPNAPAACPTPTSSAKAKK